MQNSQLSQFVDKLRTDEALRQKLAAAEKEVQGKVVRLLQENDGIRRANMEAVNRIAREAGFDLTMDMGRPDKGVTPTAAEAESSSCWLFTCCLVGTSVSPPFTSPSICPDTSILATCDIVIAP